MRQGGGDSAGGTRCSAGSDGVRRRRAPFVVAAVTYVALTPRGVGGLGGGLWGGAQTGDKLLATQEPEMPAYNTRVQINREPGKAARSSGSCKAARSPGAYSASRRAHASWLEPAGRARRGRVGPRCSRS